MSEELVTQVVHIIVKVDAPVGLAARVASNHIENCLAAAAGDKADYGWHRIDSHASISIEGATPIKGNY